MSPPSDETGWYAAARRTTIEDRLRQARSRIRRFTAAEAHAAAARGAVIIDVRCGDDRSKDGAIPGAVHVPLSLLEWRCDPASGSADDRVSDLDRTIILVCNEGYSSTLAAAALTDLGFRKAGDVIGGFVAWLRAGLPVDGDVRLPAAESDDSG
ncbi:MAG: rhodanese-like domain-containing protein [Acidimicrobiia bacterium]